jgi:hypothetical protein
MIVFDKAHLPTCKFRRIVVKDYETLFVITDSRCPPASIPESRV